MESYFWTIKLNLFYIVDIFFPTQIQRNLQLRIEEQGRQLKMMIDQQQKTNECLLNKQELDNTSFDHDLSFSLEDMEASIAETSGNARFPSR